MISNWFIYMYLKVKTGEANKILITFNNQEILELAQIILKSSKIKDIVKKDSEFTGSILLFNLIMLDDVYFISGKNLLTCSS